MTEPIVYVDRFTVSDGKLEDLTHYADDMVQAVSRDHPGVSLFGYYVDEAGRSGTAVFVFADAETLDRYLDAMAPKFADGAALVGAASIELLGRPSDRAAQLTRSFNGVIKSRLAGFSRA
jgi:hypothetical protein